MSKRYSFRRCHGKSNISFFIGVLLSLSSISQVLNADVAANLASASVAIKTHDSNASINLDFLKKALRDREIVLLGEFSHAVKDINQLKNQMIRYLHEKMGFEILLLESGIGEFIAVDIHRKEMTAQQMAQLSLIGPWWTSDYLELMEYLRSKPGLALGGFDVQKSGVGSPFKTTLGDILEKIQPGSRASAEEMENESDTLLMKMQAKELDPSVSVAVKRLVTRYENTITELNKNKNKLLEKGDNGKLTAQVIKTLENRQYRLNYFLQFKLDSNIRKRFAARDSMMAMNIIWTAKNLYPGKKIIISAHNYHIAKYNRDDMTMGEMLKNEFGKKLYSIGFFAAGGDYADNSRRIKKMQGPAGPNDIQHLIGLARYPVTFLPVPVKEKKGNHWIFTDVIVNDSFISIDGGNTLKLGESFDGLILFKKVGAAKFFNYINRSDPQ